MTDIKHLMFQLLLLQIPREYKNNFICRMCEGLTFKEFNVTTK